MKTRGFTLIELVAVIMILSILVVSAFPTNQTGGFSATTDQHQVIALLRNVQNRAMQNTQDNSCQGVYITADNIGLASQVIDDDDATRINCDNNFETASDNIDGFLNISLDNTFSVSDSGDTDLTLIEFDNWGRPELYNSDDERIGASVTIDGTVMVCIESQGYIHEC